MFPLLLFLFAASGCAALIYEIIWLQLLQLVIGSTAVSIAALLGAYMGGLCAGSFLLPRFVPVPLGKDSKKVATSLLTVAMSPAISRRNGSG